jgi:hypothetical protein
MNQNTVQQISINAMDLKTTIYLAATTDNIKCIIHKNSQLSFIFKHIILRVKGLSHAKISSTIQFITYESISRYQILKHSSDYFYA